MNTTTDTPQVVKPIPTSGGMTLDEAIRANLNTGTLLLCKEALVTAIQDKRLHRGHLRVLAAIATFMNSATAKAWPGRAAIATLLGMPVKTVSNLLTELRGFGYLIADRQAVEEANNRRLTVYTWGNIDHETIRREITKFVEGMREVPPRRDQELPTLTGTSRPDGNSKVPPQRESPAPAGTLPAKVPPQRAESSRPSGDSNSYKNSRGVEGKCALCNSDAPHLCLDGFSISRKHDLFIPMQAIDAWRKRFSKIPDLEAKIEKLSALILSKGHMYPGWSQPGAWMSGCLSDDNKRAADEERLTNAKLAKASAVDPARKNWATAKR